MNQLFEIIHPKQLYFLKCLFRLVGITTNQKDRLVMKYSGLIITLCLWSAVIASIYKLSYKLITTHSFNYNDVGMQIWMIYASISYTTLYIRMTFCKNLFQFLEEISLPESNEYGKIRSPLYKLSNTQTLNQMSATWISLSALFAITATILTIVIFGPIELIRSVVPSFHNQSDVLYLILLFISNVTCPVPMVIVRLGAYFTEQRILGMIHYLETEKSHLHTVPITSLMGWYDDVYRLNSLLTEVVSPFVTCAILILFPQIIFLLQGGLLQELSPKETMCLFVWVIYALFMLLVICCSVAQLDSLNRRFEIALGCIVSRNEFASSETVNAFDLALAKAKSLPFGVTFYGTNAMISYSSIYKISTIIISIFVFFVRYN